MREILFRGQGIDGNWYYGVPLVFTEDYVCMTAPHTYNKSVLPETVGQFTGLTDRNGIKVFDGDILVFRKGATHPIKVYWDGLGWKFLRNGKNIQDAFECNTIDHIKFCEVIGNIHDNPELLHA